MTARGVFSSWETLAIKSVRRVSVPESSWAILLKQSAISPKPSPASRLCKSGTRAEKSPWVICSAALMIFRTGRPTIHFRRRPSMRVHSSASSRMLRNVTLAAASTYS